MEIPDVLSNPVVIWGFVFVVLSGYALTVSERLQKALGPLGKWLGERKLRRLKRAGELNDARVEELSEQVQFLRSESRAVRDELRQIRSEQRDQWSLLRTHQQWDDKVASQVRELGGVVEDPPPLYPKYAA